MSDYGDDQSDYDYDSDGDWLYVEDHYDEVDNLAEHTCPSPLPDSINVDTSEYDPYDYWQDITYLSDGYEGTTKSKRKSKPTVQSPGRLGKRRRTGPSTRRSPNTSVVQDSLVVWKSKQEREQNLNHIKLVDLESLYSVSVLKDWKERFRGESGAASIANSDFSRNRNEVSDTGLDLGDIRSIAGLLSDDSIDTLKGILKEKGLDPEALDVVLQDLFDGREPDFEADEAEPHPSTDEELDGKGPMYDSQNQTSNWEANRGAASITSPQIADTNISSAFRHQSDQFSVGGQESRKEIPEPANSESSAKMTKVRVDSTSKPGLSPSQESIYSAVADTKTSNDNPASRKRKRSSMNNGADKIAKEEEEGSSTGGKRVTRSAKVRKA